jgi:hypothetical protein
LDLWVPHTPILRVGLEPNAFHSERSEESLFDLAERLSLTAAKTSPRSSLSPHTPA